MLGRWFAVVVGFVFFWRRWRRPSTTAIPLRATLRRRRPGEYEFRINCALCHGLGARGGGRGPDLTRANKKHTHSDAEMFQVISNGIAGTAMPANGTNGQGVGMTDAEIWQIITYIRSQEVRASPANDRECEPQGKICFMATRIARCATWSTAKEAGWARI